MKSILLLTSVIVFTSFSAFASTKQINYSQAEESLKNLEKSFDGKIGVYAINTGNNQIITNRADERFPVQSTMKLLSVAALLKQSNSSKNLLQEKVHYTKNDLMFWHPVTGQYVTSGMTLAALSEAAISYSDNTAANLITRKLGGGQNL